MKPRHIIRITLCVLLLSACTVQSGDETTPTASSTDAISYETLSPAAEVSAAPYITSVPQDSIAVTPTPEAAQEIIADSAAIEPVTAILYEQIPELEYYGKWIAENSDGEAVGELVIAANAKRVEGYDGEFYSVSYNECRSDRQSVWDCFLVDAGSGMVLWEDFTSGEIRSMEEWREGEAYRTDILLYYLEDEPYAAAYKDFMLSYEGDQDTNFPFPIFGYYLVDMNFDDIPELAILHHSGGSMGGYFTFYCYNGERVEAIRDMNVNAVRNSNYSRLLADYENRKVYFFREMYLLLGNENGYYGHVYEVVDNGGIPSVNYILHLEVDTDLDLEVRMRATHDSEDGYLSDPELEECLITEQFFGGEWIKITSAQYLEVKQRLVPDADALADLYYQGVHYYLYDGNGGVYDEDGMHRTGVISEGGICKLFLDWANLRQ